MEFNVVDKSAFGKHVSFERLDAEFVSPTLLEAEESLRQLKGCELRQLSVPYGGPTINDSFAGPDTLLSYVSIDDVDTSDGLTYSSEVRFEDRPSRAKYEVRVGDVLVSNVRPNRNAVALTGQRLEGALASSGFTLVRARNGGLPSEFLFAFMKSPYWVGQLLRRNRGSMYPAVLPNDVLDAWIPEPTTSLRKSVVAGVRRGLDLQEEFFRLHGKAQDKLEDFLEPLGAPPSPLHTDRTGADWTGVTRGELFRPGGPRRFDAEFFRGEYHEFDDRARRWSGSFVLGERYRLAPGTGLKNGDAPVPVVKQAVLTNTGVNWSAISLEPGTFPTQGDVQDSDILLACTAHEIYYVGRRVDFVRKVPAAATNNVAVADVMVCRHRSGTPAISGSYLAAFLRSPSGLHQIQRCIRGLRGGHVYKNDLESYVRVPVPSSKWLRRFEDIVSRAETARNEAKGAIQAQVDKVGGWLTQAGITALVHESLSA